jgi:CheY-like chemotaxis protein
MPCPREEGESAQSDCVCIVIADQGLGMDEETRRHVFEPFFTTKGPGKGTGLGLALVYGVVNAHHGFIDIESKAGAGTTVRIYLPVAGDASTSCEDESPSGVARGTEHLLLIEDEEPLRNALTDELRSRGYCVLAASDGVHALQLCRGGEVSFDAVVTDLGMPEMSAQDLVAALRQISPGTPVVGMTGYVDVDVHANVFAAGVNRIVQKPFAIDELVRTVREALDERHLPM